MSCQGRGQGRRRGRRDHSKSPPRRGGSRDHSESPPRRGGRRDQSKSPPRRGSRESSESPPRRGGRRDQSKSPPRRGGHRDQSKSPPRRGDRRDQSKSPPRRWGCRGQSPPERPFFGGWPGLPCTGQMKIGMGVSFQTSGTIPSEVSNPVIQPPIPYVGTIDGGIRPGMRLHVEGIVPLHAKQFQINFKTGEKDADDVAFHFNPRIGLYVYMNIFRNGRWQKEELRPGNFEMGAPFKLLFLIHKDFYEVHLNGVLFYKFSHRIPLNKVTTLAMSGDVLIMWFGFEKWTQPSFKNSKLILMGIGSTTFIPLEVSDLITNPALPYVAAIPGWLKQDIAFVFQGIAPEDNNRFEINFKTGPSDGDDIAFHYNPRIGSITALNSFRNRSWELQIDAPVKPFTSGGAFIILIVINSQGYEVYVNGFKHCTFKHRIPLEKVSTVHVGGKVSLLLCGFIASWSTTLSYKELKKITSTQTTTSSLTCLPFDISNPISMPELPYVGKIPGGLKQDMAVFLQGTVHGDAKSFAINFKTGPSDGDDIAFHFNPRFGSITALNSFRNGSWETEENAPDEPFTTGGAFQIFIAINSNGYEVYVNGLKHCTFKHRIPLDKVSALSVNGDISLLLCGFIQKWMCPSLFVKEKKFILMGSGSSTFIPLEVSDPVSNPALPYVAAIPGALKQDIAFVFQGIAPENNNRFAINFKMGPSDGDVIAFHYNPRIGSITALNSFRNGSWELQIDAPIKPFTRRGAFIILIVINSQGYDVYVNGFKHCTFKHRIPLEKVSTVHVGGKVSLLLCGFIASWSTTSSYKELKKITSTQTTTSSLTCLPFNISHPISMPELPYVGKIPGGLKQDMAVFLQGTVHGDAKSFAINFKTGPSDGDDIAFHFNPRFGSITALNSFRNGSWETQENAPDEPFTTGGAFQIFIAINSNGYEVYVNGLKHCTFKHRIPLDKVSALSVNGDISLLLCGFIQKWTCPSLFVKEKKFILMGSGSSTFIPLEVSDPVSNPALPYVAAIPGWLKQDIAFVFQGIAPEDNNRFEINFKTGPSDGDDIAFHYNPRIGSITALNSFRNRSWELQIDAPVKPFTSGGAFTILIVINSQGYEVYVNGFKHCTFKHRIPLEKVSTVHVGGKVSLLLCGFIASWSTTSSYKELKKIPSTQTSTSSLTCLPFNISYPISMPELPYVGKIPGGLKQDMAVFLQGTVHGDAKSFAVNFKTGPSDGDDIAFHFNPRFGSITALNSFRNGTWETEENAPDEPFTTGEAFQIFIAINSNGYEVYVNGLKHCTFKHRIPLDKVSALSVNGDISLLIYGLIRKWTCPSLFLKEKKFILMGSGSSTFIPLEVSDPVSNPALPYVAAIPGWLKQDIAFVFQGIAPEDNNRFEINFKTGPSDGDDIAFHYNPRIGSITALNSFRNRSWELQIDAPIKPFTSGGAFTILIVINSQGYEVYVNGFKHCTFKHRIPLEKVSTVHVRGKVSLLLCGFIASWSTTSSYKELKKITSTQTTTSSLTCLPFNISNPISMPELPYVGKIPGGLKQDMAVFLQGTVHGGAKSFAVNFKTGPSDGDDIAFHFNPRFGSITALNSFRNGSWETQENAPDEPFTTGGAFQIFIAINSNGYEVYVNGLKHCTFKHRIPLDKVSALSVNGDISLLLCGFIRKWMCPNLFVKEKKFILMGSGSSTFIPLEVSDPVSNPALPYVAAIPGWLKQDRAFVFQGIAPEDNNRFEINFKTGPSDGDDIAFHYNPRIGSITALNSFRNRSWELQIDAPVKPFTSGGAFTILIIINSQGYEVYVNGFKHCTFKHRIPLEKVSTVHVGGKVSLLLCGFIASWSTTSSYKELKKITSTQTTTSSLTCLPLNISNPISMPELPYVGKIPGGLKQDMAVFLQGTVHGGAKSFAINFKTGPSDGDDIAFHFNPRFGSITALNSFRNGSWETQENAPDEPFTTGGAFQIFIAINSNGYEVYVNGLKHCTFKHRIPLDKVSALNVNGDISLLLYGLIPKWTCPSLFVKEKKFILMGSGSSTFIPLEVSDPVSNPALPYVAAIPGALKQDIAFIFQGIAPEDNNRFEINFKTGPSDGDDIAFHYNPRIGSITALNSFRNRSWELQIDAPIKPFTSRGAFTILIVINSQGYEVYVNGFKHCTFKHRIPLEKVSTVHIGGKVSLLLCGFIASWSTTSSYQELKKITSTQTTTSSLTCLPFNISNPISMPELPYVGKIPGGLKQDMAVFLQGTVHGGAKSFAINFKTGPSDGDDIAFHFNPRFGSITALNSFRNGSWETQENAPDEPFTTGGAFQIFIAINSNGYEVYVNGLKHCTFKHRIPLDKVSALSINGDISLLLYGLIRKWTCPSLFVKEKKFILMGSGSSTFIPLEVSDPVSNPALPYVAAIPGWLKQDIAFIFQGIAPEDNNRFVINFKTGPSDGDDIAFHYNPRIGSITALNSFRNGSWELQIDAPVKPFTSGGAFTILIVINSQGYEVYVNGFKHCTFKHRIPLEKVSTVHVGGKVSLLLCGFIASWSTTSSYKELKKITSTQTTTSNLTCLPFNISHPISMPELPYVGKIPGGLKQDMAVFLQGTVHGDAKSFAINFKTGPFDGDDIAFHFNPRFGSITALNSFRNGSWETEENAPDEPFTMGEAFQIFIAINSNGYEVYVNGLKHCTFKHRIPLDKVSALNVNGGISLLLCGFIQKWTCPSLFVKEKKFILMGSGSSTFIPLEVSDPVSNPALPYVAAIPGWLKQDIAFVFQGIAPEDNNRFAINFKTGPSDGDDIAFHYNPRIGSITALNSFRNGSWELQIDAPVKPFTSGGAFTILIVINPQGYEVYVNGFKHCTFKHRIPLEKVSTVHVGGKVSLLLCGFIASWTTTSSYKELKKIPSTQITTSSLTCLPFNISHPISMPELPYVGKIPGGLKQDMAVFLQGTVHGDAKSFAINFKTGPSDGDDIAFHFNPRFGSITALNSFRNGTWETQENAPDEPFTTGGAFQIFIAINSNGYEVYVNGLKHCTFKHRIPLDKVSALSVNGDISLLLCGFIRKWMCPSLFVKEKKFILMGSGSSTFIPLEVSDPVSNPALPYVAAIPGWLKQDRAFVFQGIAPEDNNRFEINFKTGPSDGDDIAFHYNPRIGSITALNSFRNRSWELQIDAPVKPFTSGGAFIILIVINSQGYEVYVNGFKHCTFKHRIPLEKVSTVHVGGKVSLLLCGFIASWSTTSSYKELKKITSTQTTTSSLTCLPLNISNPISMPELPYVGKIPGGLKQDMAVFLQGTVHGDAKSFAINFKTGPSDGDDIAFHFNPRFGSITALNSFRNGSWETQENAPDEPFTTGGAFQIFIAINSNGYEVYVNGLKHCTFKHRIPLDKVSALSVNGDISLLLYGLIPIWTCPSLFVKEKKFILMGSGSSTFIPLEVSDPVSNPALPYVAAIPGWLKQDIAFVFQGIAPEDNNRFAINFKTGPSDGDDIAFHYNPRIGSITALNSFRNGSWELQIDAPVKPFTSGGAFTILIVISSQGYEVYVNGFKHCTFKHRIPLEKVSTVHVGGKVSLLLCGFIASWSTTSSYKELKKITSTQTSTSSLTCLPFNISHTISMPELPYVGKIPGGLKQDMAVFLQGTVHGDAKSFAINFKTGPSDGDDIAFHFNPRFGSITALNSFRNGSWETEENAPDEPFTTGGAFQIFIAINSNGYEVYVNGLKHCTFKHRIPLDKVSALNVNGDISLLLYGFIQKWTCPSLFVKEKKFILMGSGSLTFIPLEVSDPVSNPALPYVAAIPGWLKQDIAFVFQGIAPEDNNRFSINFKTGPSDGDDIAFHYNPRIGSITALNSFRNGSWELQIDAPVKPFTSGGAFTVLIVINSQGYEVYVNGFKHCTFNHRIPLEKVSTVHVGGKVSLLLCGFIASWSTTSSYQELKKIPSTQITTSSLACLPFNISHPISMPELPYVGKIPGGLKQDMAVFLQGTVHGDAKSFAINFKTGPSDGDDIAFHFNPRFGSITALNSFRNGSWETEENAPDEPFTTGGAFQIFIAINSNGYEVYVNGLKHCTFKHRIPLDKVSALSVNGDISLLLYGFIRKWTCPSLFVKEKKFILTGSGSSTFIPLEVSDPVSNPALPYVAAIPGWLKQDIAFVFQGIAPEDNNRFSINFKTGPSDGDDIAFHYNPRIGSITALNSFRNGSWELQIDAPVKPFTSGGAFIILIVINSQGYEVYVNGFKHCTFKHRIPLEKVSTVHVGGKVSLLLCGFIASWSTTLSYKELKKIPSTQTITSSLTSTPLEISRPVINPALPYVAQFPREMHQDRALFFQGTVEADAESFEINFKTGLADDIAFHYKPIIGNYTALNSFRNGSWETEETAPDTPFTRGKAFQIIVAINSEAYEVYVNNVKHCVFKHRIPLEKVSTLIIRGDVSQLICGFIYIQNASSFFTELQKIATPESVTTGPVIPPPVGSQEIGYLGEIPGGIKEDMAVLFKGSIPPDGKGFEINFKTGPADGDDIAFHYKPVIGKYTALNSFRNRSWETEETAPDPPFSVGEEFQIIVVINTEDYEVYVNSVKHCVFKHRIPPEKVSTLFVLGDVSQFTCTFIQGWSTSSYFIGLQKPTTCIFPPIIQPALQYLGEIPGGIKEDMAVLFKGSIPPDGKGFEINFKTGPADGDDIAFHYKPVIGKYTALNSFRNGSWETEETAPDPPFSVGEEFQIIVVINTEDYEVYVNSVKHCVFKHRIPPEKVSTLALHGDVSQFICTFIQGWSTSSYFIELQKPTICILPPLIQPALQYLGEIPGGIKEDMAVLFKGSIPPDGKGFEINFKTGPADGDDIAFHYKPVIGKYTALNSFRNGNWETEETAPDPPFSVGEEFQIIVVINTEDYEVYVNSVKHCVFKHRIPPEKVSTLALHGDVSQFICTFIQGWSTSSYFIELQKPTGCIFLPPVIQPYSLQALQYLGEIPGGIKEDMAVLFKGSIPPDGKGFEINFKTGPADGDDIAFHYKPVIGKYTALNSFRNGNWETEETAPDPPFSGGEEFQIIVVINTEDYEVYVNSVKHCVFKHRIPPEKVSTLFVLGDVSQFTCTFIQGWSTSSFFIELQNLTIPGAICTLPPIIQPALQYLGEISGGIKEDMTALFKGCIPPEAKDTL
ncbi:uncharacterized protein LOC132887734 isoform X2 [Neoarius graeffei]|uniref:uncharacterized protein LOC132887734 isoform X2 n=1 Tax=Neoarius graeffei TaxID=443677 RepID=UPI00298CE36D|nr:uncharacterized protein LOC132887734 isoform X2 [Neoarius graeffei]